MLSPPTTPLVERHLQALLALLPSGYAWPRHDSATLWRVVRGLAAALADQDAHARLAVYDWQPHTTRTRLPEWEAATHLPDACFGTEQTTEARRARVLTRLRGPQGAYADSSPAAPGAIEAQCVSLGYAAQVRYNVPFRAGRDRVGARLGQLDGRLHCIVEGRNEPMRAGRGRAGDRLVDHGAGASELACFLDSLVPARYALDVTFATA